MWRSIMVAPAMAFALAVPALAQQTDAQTRSQVEAVVMKFEAGADLGGADRRRFDPFHAWPPRARLTLLAQPLNHATDLVPTPLNARAL
jgi:hypothetical protein